VYFVIVTVQSDKDSQNVKLVSKQSSSHSKLRIYREKKRKGKESQRETPISSVWALPI